MEVLSSVSEDEFIDMEVQSSVSEDEFIDMEVLSFNPSSSSPSPPKHITISRERDFEFPLSSSSSANLFNSQDHQKTADELFHQGKLLPLLHHPPPPRLHIVHKLLTHQNFVPRISSTNPSTPLISPPESCRVSCDLNPEDYCFFEWSNELKGFTKKGPNNWHKKLYHKLKASRTYIKSLFFTKSSTCRMENTKNNGRRLLLAKENDIGCKKIPLKDLVLLESHRKSFSGAIQGPHGSGSSSSSSSSSTPSLSFNSNGGYEIQLLQRSRSADSELESSIQGAIAHCKQSRNGSVEGSNSVSLTSSKSGRA